MTTGTLEAPPAPEERGPRRQRRKASRLSACLAVVDACPEIAADLLSLLDSSNALAHVGELQVVEIQSHRTEMERLRAQRDFAEELPKLTLTEKASLRAVLAEIKEARG